MSINDEQIKAESIRTINSIFKHILTDLRKHPDLTEPALYEYQLFNIELYRDALIQEVRARRALFDHPLRAAFALDKLHKSNVENFQTNLNKFKEESQHSGFYPTTKKIAALVAHSLILGGSIALTVLVSGWFAFLAVPAFFSFIKNVPKVCANYQDIHHAKAIGKEVHNFYSMFRKKPVPSVPDQEPPQYQPDSSSPKIG